MSVSSFNIVPNVIKPKSSALESTQWTISPYGDSAKPQYSVLVGMQDVGYGETSATNFWDGLTPPTNGWTIYQNVGNGSGINIRIAQADNELIQLTNELIPSAGVANRHEAVNALINNNFYCPNFDLPDFQSYALIGAFLTGWSPSFDTDGSGFFNTIYGFSYLNMEQYFGDGNSNPINLDLQDAVIFDGTNYLYMGSNAAVPQGTNEFSASIWFKAPDVGTQQTLFAWGNQSTPGEYVRVYIQGGDVTFTTGDGMDVVSDYGFSTDTWYNISVSCGLFVKQLFINGDIQGSNNVDVNITGQDVYIGTTNDATGYFTGSINNFMIYNIQLGSEDFYWNYTNLLPYIDKTVSGDDFTIEWYMKANDVSAFPRVYSFNQYPNCQNGVSIEGGTIIWWANAGARLFASNPNPYDGNWHHVAITRNSGVVTCWFDGVSCGTTTYAPPIITSDNLMIGTEGIGTTTSGSNACFDGLLSNFEYTVGLSKYNTTFTPSTTPLSPSVPYTKLLDLQSTTNITALLADQSGNGNNATDYNSPLTSNNNPFGDSTISLQLNSTLSQYLVIPASSTFDIN